MAQHWVCRQSAEVEVEKGRMHGSRAGVNRGSERGLGARSRWAALGDVL